MAEGPLRARAGAARIEAEAVEVARAPSGRVQVIVRATGDAAGLPSRRCALVVPSRGRRLRFPPVEGLSPVPARNGALEATFSVPAALLPALAGQLQLEVGGEVLALPPADVPEAQRNGGAQVVDRAVLAERRARRAELAERDSARRAEDAETESARLRTEVGELQARLERVATERRAVEDELEERDRALRAAVQRAHAEARQREEELADAATRQRETEDELQRVRARLETGAPEVAEAAARAEELRRRAAEAVNALASAERGRRRAEEAAARSQQRVASLEQALAEAQAARERLESALASSELVRGELEELARARPAAADVDALRDENRRRGEALAAAERDLAQTRETVARALARLEQLERPRTELLARLDAERAARGGLEAELAEAQAATALAQEAVEALRDELEQRSDLQRRAQRLIVELHGQVRTLREEGAARQHGPSAGELVMARFIAAANRALAEAERDIESARGVAEVAGGEAARERARRAEAEAEAKEAQAALRKLRGELEQERGARERLVDGHAREVTARHELMRALHRGGRLEHDLQQAEDEAAAGAGAGSQTAGVQQELAMVAGRLEQATAAAEVLEGRVDLRRRLADEERARRAAEEALESRGSDRGRLDVEREHLSAAQVRIVAEREHLAAERERLYAERDRLAAQLELTRATVAAQAATPPAPAPFASDQPWLARALRAMVRDDPDATATLLLALVRGQGLQARRPLDYDLDLAEAGPHAVVLDGKRAEVRALEQPRSPGEADFRLALHASALVELLVRGGSRRLARETGVRVTGTRFATRALRSLPPVPLQLDRLEPAVRLDPSLSCRALTHLISPEWTRGHSFCVGFEPEDREGAAWHVRVRDGAPPAVTRTPPATGPQAIVRLPTPAFARLLSGEASACERGIAALSRRAIRGDAHAVALLAQWLDWAQGTSPPV